MKQQQLIQQQQLKQSYFMHPGYSNPFMPVKDPSQTTEATSSTASMLPPQHQQQMLQQQQLKQSYFMHPGYSNHFMPVKDPSQTTEAPTTEAPTTTEATSSTASKLPPQNQQQQQQRKAQTPSTCKDTRPATTHREVITADQVWPHTPTHHSHTPRP